MYIHISIPIPNWKGRGFPIPIPIPSQCEDSTSKRGRVRAIPTGPGLFAIFTSRLSETLICSTHNPSPGRGFKNNVWRFSSWPHLGELLSLKWEIVSLNTKGGRLSETLEPTPITSFCNFRLGERDSLGRKLQRFSPVHAWNQPKPYQKPNLITTKHSILTSNHNNMFYTHWNHKSLVLDHIPSSYTQNPHSIHPKSLKETLQTTSNEPILSLITVNMKFQTHKHQLKIA